MRPIQSLNVTSDPETMEAALRYLLSIDGCSQENGRLISLTIHHYWDMEDNGIPSEAICTVLHDLAIEGYIKLFDAFTENLFRAPILIYNETLEMFKNECTSKAVRMIDRVNQTIKHFDAPASN